MSPCPLRHLASETPPSFTQTNFPVCKKKIVNPFKQWCNAIYSSSKWQSTPEKCWVFAGTKAGDNTLNCYTALLMIRTFQSTDGSTTKEELAKKFFANYVKIMVTPGSHPDSFAESHHRYLFSYNLPPFDWFPSARQHILKLIIILKLVNS